MSPLSVQVNSGDQRARGRRALPLTQGGNAGREGVNADSHAAALRLASHQNRFYLSGHIFPSFIKASGGLLGPATGNCHLGRPEGSLPGSGGLHLTGVLLIAFTAGLSLHFQPRGRAVVSLALDGSFQVCLSQGPCALTLFVNTEPVPPCQGIRRRWALCLCSLKSRGSPGPWALCSSCTRTGALVSGTWHSGQPLMTRAKICPCHSLSLTGLSLSCLYLWHSVPPAT